MASESRIQETYDDDVATLVIKKVKVEDEGEYVCRATNDEGSDTSSAQLTVKGNVPFGLVDRKSIVLCVVAHVAGENEEAYNASLAQEDEVAVQAAPQAASEQPSAEAVEGVASDTAAKVEEKLPSEAVAEVPESENISTEPTPIEAPVGTEPAPVAEPVPEPVPEPAPEPVKPAAGKAAPAKKPAAVEKKPVGAAALKKPEPAKKADEKKEAAAPAAKKPAADEKKKVCRDERAKQWFQLFAVDSGRGDESSC